MLMICTVACTAQKKNQDEEKGCPMQKMVEELGLSDQQAQDLQAVFDEMRCGARLHAPRLEGAHDAKQCPRHEGGRPCLPPPGDAQPGRPCPPRPEGAPDSLKAPRPEGRPCPPQAKEGQQPRPEGCPEAHQGPRPEHQSPEMMEQRKAEFDAKIKSILNEEQYAKFQQMQQERANDKPKCEKGEKGEKPHKQPKKDKAAE